MNKELKKQYKDVCEGYLKAFCEAYGARYEKDSWVAGDVGTIACVGENYFDFNEVVKYSVDNNLHDWDELMRWYDYTLFASEYKQTIAIVGRAAMRGRPLFSSSCAVAVTIRRNIDICSRNFGDVDNHVKAVLDAINGVCYTDDRLVVSVIAIKIKSAVEGVDVIVADSLLDILSNLKEEPS